MSRITDLIRERNEQLHVDGALCTFPWLLSEGQRCVLSPDSDGFLCGLFMAHHLAWQICGFYDGKILLVKRGVQPHDCVFLDVEICTTGIRSVGHHMLLFNNNDVPDTWPQLNRCLQPNIIRGYDAKKHFRLKYPLATIHLLLATVGRKLGVVLPDSAIRPLLFVDGTYQNLFGYPENVMNWLEFLGCPEQANPLRAVFMSEGHSVYGLMQAMDGFFRKRDEFSIPKLRGDQLRITDTRGRPTNLEQAGNVWRVSPSVAERKSGFVRVMAEDTGWCYRDKDWPWEGFEMRVFSKGNFKGEGRRLNGRTFRELMGKNPLSWAITANDELEYTLEEPDALR